MAAPVVDAAPSPWGEAYARLLQLEDEYMEVMEAPNPDAVAAQAELAFGLASLVATLGPEAGPLERELRPLADAVKRATPASELSLSFRRAFELLEHSGRLVEAPSRPPDGRRAAALFAQGCAACHGSDGAVRDAKVTSLNPPAANFHAQATMNGLSPMAAYHVITYGEVGTAMPGFSVLSEEERWGLAYHLFTLRQPPCPEGSDGATLQLPAKRIALSSDDDLVASFGEQSLGCIRRRALTY